MSKSEMPFLTRVAKANVTASVRTTIPKEIADHYDINEHDVIIWRINKKTNELIIKKWDEK